MPRYPIYIPSYGRPNKCLTAKFLDRDGVPFRVVVEPSQAEDYAKTIGRERLLILPDHLTKAAGVKGVYLARNWIKSHSIQEGFARHWQLDDNIRVVRRYFGTQRVVCNSGAAFRTVEDFVERYTNVAVAGLNYNMFISGKELRANPYVLNAHVYSFTLMNNEIPHLWRLVYNEDTDLCLQVLSDGWCTVQVNTFVAEKVATMRLRGGNTDQLYAGDGRNAMARQLHHKWPHVVKIDRRWGRPQHVVNWAHFTTPLKPKSGVKSAEGSYKVGGLLEHLRPEAPPSDERGLDLKVLDAKVAMAHPELSGLVEHWKAVREKR